MSSGDRDVDSTGCGVAAVVDTSWIDNAAVSAPSGGDGGRVTRGRGDRKRATRRRTLSPSIGKHNYMSNVDLNDPRTFPILPSSSCDRGLDSSDINKTTAVSAGKREAVDSIPVPVNTVKVDTFTRAGLCVSPSSGLGAAGRDADLPDPTVVAGLFDVDGTSPSAPTRALPLGVLGTLGNNEVVASSSAAARVKAASKRQPPGEERQGRSSTASAAPSRGRSSRRATLGGADARIFFEAENLEPILPNRPPPPAAVAAASTPTAAAAAATKATAMKAATAAATDVAPAATDPGATRSPSTEAGQGQAPDHAPLPTASVLPVDDKEEERRAPPPPPVAAKKSRSRSSRRRSIVMPSEARPLMDSDLDDVGGNANVPMNIADGGSDGDIAAGAATAAPATPAGEVEPSRRGSSSSTSTTTTSKMKTPAVELPLSSMNATTCLSRSLAVQRGWAVGDETTRKDLFRAFYAAAPGSQRARRIAARLFCLTGYPLSPVAPEDARVLCEAAGGSLDWGLGETEPRLVSRPIRRETREQKRRLVLRIKPIFDLMEKASKEERLQAEAATGVASRKASPDGFCYENRETGKPVDPDAYKGAYLKHVQAARVSRLRKFAARRNVAPSTPREEGSGSSPAVRQGASPSAKMALPPPASEPGAVAAADEEEEVGSREREDPASSPLGAAAEEPPKEVNNLVGASAGEGRGGEDSRSEECADNGMTAAAKGDTGAEGNASEAISVVANALPSGSSAGTSGAVSETAMPEEEGGTMEVVTTSPAVLGAPVAAVEAALVVETTEEIEDEETAASTGSETPMQIAAEVDGAVPAVKGEESLLAEPGVGDINVAGEASDLESLAETGGEIRIPCFRAADGASGFDSPQLSDGCSPCTTATPMPESVRARLEEHAAASDRGVTAVASPLAQTGQRTPGNFGQGSDGKVSGSDAQSPHFPGSPSPVMAIERTSRLMTTSGEGSMPFGEYEFCGSGRPDGLGTDQNEVPTTSDGRETVSASMPSTQEGDPSARASSEGAAALGAAVLEKPCGASCKDCAASPPHGPEATGRQQDEPLSGRTPGAGRGLQRASPSRIFSLMSATRNLGSPGAAEFVVGSGQEEGEDAVEIAALEQRLWAAIDAAFRDYHDGVSLVVSRRQGASTPSLPAPSQESTETANRSSADAAVPPPAVEARATTALPTTCSAAGCELGEKSSPDSRAASPADGAIMTAAASSDGMPTPDSPLLPLLQVRLREEEEDELFEFSSSWRGAGSGDGSSQSKGGKWRRRSLANAFSSQMPLEETKSREAGQVGAEPAASKSEIGTDGDEHRTADVVMCRLCCRKACDTVLRPCEHSACRVCVEKLRVQAERSGQHLSCPWDRQSVDETCPL